MKFMIMVRANADTEAGRFPPDVDKLMAQMAAFHEELARAGALLDASGLQPSSKGWRVRYGEGEPRIIDGPYAESKELVAGYTLIQVRDRQEAIEWSRRYPNPMGEGVRCEIEVRQLYELEDFEAMGLVENTQRFREIGVQ